MAEPHDGSFNGPHDLYTRPLVQFKAETKLNDRMRNWLRVACCCKSLTTNLPISPSVLQHHTTKAAVLCQNGNPITNALGSLVSVVASAVVRDAIFHQNVFVEHFQAVFHFRVLQQIVANKVCLLLDGRLACDWRDWLRASNALLLILVHVDCSPRVHKRRSHLTSDKRKLFNKSLLVSLFDSLCDKLHPST